jgi:hypothetical protein
LVANPYNFSISKEDLLAKNPMVNPDELVFRKLDENGNFVNVNYFEPFTGYFFAYSGSKPLQSILLPKKPSILSKSQKISGNFIKLRKNKKITRSEVFYRKNKKIANLRAPSDSFDGFFPEKNNRFDVFSSKEKNAVFEYQIKNPERERIDLKFISSDNSLFHIFVDAENGEIFSEKTLKEADKKVFLITGSEEFVKEKSKNFVHKELGFELSAAYPNPFNPNVRLNLSLKYSSNFDIVVFNILGEKVRTLAKNKTFPSGVHIIRWNGKNDVGNKVASGIYYMKIYSKFKKVIRKLVLVK